MNKLLSWLKWLDDNLIRIFIVGFIFIIPLYPKFPLRIGGKLLIIDYTYIAVRAEDLFMAIFIAFFVLQLLRKKITLSTRFLKLTLLFWIAVLLSFLWGSFIQKTIIYKHLGLFHAIRRVEYMAIFVIMLSTLQSKREFLVYLRLILFTLLLTCVYGIGQKYLAWPAVQTMNPEFAKGHLLYLTPEARVSSTFAGHYDLAAYLVFLMPLVLGMHFFRKKLLYFILFIIALTGLVLTASRSSYIAYILSTGALLLYIRKFKYFIIVAIITTGLTFLSQNLTSRFFQTVQIRRIFVSDTGQVIVPHQNTPKELPPGTFNIPIPEKSQQQPIVLQGSPENEVLVKKQILDDIRKEASKEGKVISASEEAALVEERFQGLKIVDAVVSDISFATRLQAEWPRAIKAFIRNPLLGSGPSSITEATDNDYLRWLGEFGLLGTGLFLYLLYSISHLIWKRIPKLIEGEQKLYLGFLFGLGGLMINASYIDVFEASKVAYTFWLIVGIFVASILVKNSSK